MEDKINQIILYKYKVISKRADMAFTVIEGKDEDDYSIFYWYGDGMATA